MPVVKIGNKNYRCSSSTLNKVYMSGGLGPELVADVFLSNESFEQTLKSFNTSSDELCQIIHSIPNASDYESGHRIRIASDDVMTQFRLRKEEMKAIRGLWIFIAPNVRLQPEDFEGFHMNRISFIGTTIDHSVVYGDKIEDGSRMFLGCTELTRIDFMTLNNLENGESMFSDCSKLSSLPATMTLNALTNGSRMFLGCSGLSSLPAAMTLNNLTNGGWMFAGCSKLTSLPAMTLNNLTNGEEMFYQCSGLFSLPVMTLNKLTNGERMFYGCRELTSLPTMTLNELTNGEWMFYRCSELSSLHAAMTLNKLTNGERMFDGCSGLSSLPDIKQSWSRPNSLIWARNSL